MLRSAPPVHALLHDEDGATAIEYGLIAALVCVPLIAALTNMNTMMQGLYRVMDTIRDSLF